MKIPKGKPGRTRKARTRSTSDDRSHRVKIAGKLNLEELSQALQMALVRMEEEGHTRVGYVSLYYRPVEDDEDRKQSRTIEIKLPGTNRQ